MVVLSTGLGKHGINVEVLVALSKLKVVVSGEVSTDLLGGDGGKRKCCVE